MSALAAANTPRRGDIVICRGDESPETYRMGEFPHASQLAFESYDQAVQRAIAIAARFDVDVWYTPDGDLYKPMVRHRQESWTES